jgi:ribulose-phosphate 3-epimerase
MIIAPSLLACDFGKIAHEARRAAAAGADWLHLDIMDGHFVPSLSFGPEVVRVIRPLTRIPLDVHLMCARPEVLLEAFAEAGANSITVHVELEERVKGLLWKIRSLGKKVGLAVNPATGIANVLPYLDRIDLLLVMTVNPGLGGQPFIYEMLPKIQQASSWRRERDLDYRIEVDGGIDCVTAADCARAGADVFVSGTALFSHRQLTRAIEKMRRTISTAGSPRRLGAPGRIDTKNGRVSDGSDEPTHVCR